MADRYVIVSTDPTDLTIKAGPMLWDGQAKFDPGTGLRVLLAADARTAGYTFSVPPGMVAERNADTLRVRALAALDANRAFLAVAAPTSAQLAAQIRLLTREVSAVIRLELGALDDTDGT